MKKHFIRDRKMRYGGITVALTVLVIAVTLLVNAVFGSLAARYNWITDMNELGMFDVTDECYDYLDDVFSDAVAAGASAKVEIIFCDLLKNINEESTQKQLYHTAQSLQARFPEYITLNCYDILSDPTVVRGKYDTSEDPHTGLFDEIAVSTTDVILVSEGYHRVYNLAEFFSFKDNSAENLWGYNGEKKLAAGIMKAVSPNRPTACLTNNHGEVFYDYEILNVLDDAGYKVTYLDLYQGTIPENCSLIVTYNPMSDLVLAEETGSAVSERDALESFLSEDGNSYWVFMDNSTPNLPNFEAFLENWGTDFSYHTSNDKQYRYMVQDTAQSLTSDGYTIYGEASAESLGAELFADLNRTAIFKNATAMEPAAGYVNNGDGSYTKGDRVMYSLYTGGENAVAWANGSPVNDADQAILMSLTRQTNANGTAYVGVVSSAEFATENFLQSAVFANSDVLCAVLEEQGKENTPIGLTLKPYEQTEISTVTTRQMFVWTLCLCGIPAIVLAGVGVFVLLKRRRA